MDKMWSFVGSKQEKVWIWLPQDEDTREVVGCTMGDRSATAAQQLWDSLQPVYRQCAFIHTDFWDADAIVLPAKRYKAVGKETGKTCYIERLNNTFRQCISRLVRKTLSFSKKKKKIEHHKAYIWNFIHHYNASLRLRLS